MKSFLTLLTGLFITALPMQSISQEVVFDYDPSGNRTSRTIVLEEKKQKLEIVTNTDTANLKQTEIQEELPKEYSTAIGNYRVNIFPNPNGGMFRVEIEGWEQESNITIRLHTLKGETIFEKDNIQPVTKVDIPSQPDGTYILTIIINGKNETWKIIKR